MPINQPAMNNTSATSAESSIPQSLTNIILQQRQAQHHEHMFGATNAAFVEQLHQIQLLAQSQQNQHQQLHRQHIQTQLQHSHPHPQQFVLASPHLQQASPQQILYHLAAPTHQILLPQQLPTPNHQRISIQQQPQNNQQQTLNQFRNQSQHQKPQPQQKPKQQPKQHITPHQPKKDLSELITCSLCKGFLIDAVTIDLCMHSFCRPCAITNLKEQQEQQQKQLQLHQQDHDNHPDTDTQLDQKPQQESPPLECPECKTAIKDKRFLNRLKLDTTLQSIVYKLVPNLYEKEMHRRRKFYASKKDSIQRQKQEMFGDIPPWKTIKDDQRLNVVLKCMKGNTEVYKRALCCPASFSTEGIKKLLRTKFSFGPKIKIYYESSDASLMTLKEVAATYKWSPQEKIMHLTARIAESDEQVSPVPKS